MTSRFLLLLTAMVSAILAGCSEQPRSTEGFVLPQGDAVQGQQVFTKYQCYECHSIADLEFPERGVEPPLVLSLGTRLHRVKNFGELLTAIVNPDHESAPKFMAAVKAKGQQESQPDMPQFTQQMSVAEMTDLAEFLHVQYRRLLPAYQASHPQ